MVEKTARAVQRLRHDGGSVSSWLILAAGLAAAALAASLVLQQTIGALASNVGEQALSSAAAPPAPSTGEIPTVGGDPADPNDAADPTTANDGADGAVDEDGGRGGDGGDDGDTDGGTDDGGRGGDGGDDDDTDGGTDDGGQRGDGGDDDDTDGGRGGPDPTQLDSGSDVNANGVDFTIGPYEEPEIQHDNGHLQDQSDLSNPIPEPTREPTQEEIDYYNEQLSDVVLGDRVGWLPLDQDWIPFHDPDERFAWDNAVPAYRHFLEGEGADRTFDMNDYLTSDPAGQVVEQSLLDDASTATDFALNDLASNGDLPVGEAVAFTITSDPVTTSETSTFYPYPSTTDWQRTVGGMQVWTTTDVVATRQADGSVEISTTTTIHGEDRYNFNWNQQAIDNGEPDWLRGRLELGGLAHQYTQTGSTERSDDRTVDLP